jgi:hypothetical protein
MIEWNEKQRWKDRNATESRRFGTFFDEDCGERIYLCVESLLRGILIQGGKIRTSFWTKAIACALRRRNVWLEEKRTSDSES